MLKNCKNRLFCFHYTSKNRLCQSTGCAYRGRRRNFFEKIHTFSFTCGKKYVIIKLDSYNKEDLWNRNVNGNIDMLYPFSRSIDGSGDENIVTGKIRGWFSWKLRELRPQDLSLAQDFEGPRRGRSTACHGHLILCRRYFKCNGLRFLSLSFLTLFISPFPLCWVEHCIDTSHFGDLP